MKKRALKNFTLNKKTISKLERLKYQGGAIDSSFNECIRTLDLNGVNICFQTQQKTCGVSVFVDCITQTELPTCRVCI